MEQDPDTASAKSRDLSRVAVKIPTFWRKNVNVWFTQLDSQFITCNISSQVTKYHYVLAALETEIVEQILDLVSKPLSSTPYDDLRKRLISEFEESEDRKTKKLLTELTLGDGKPTALLRQMRSLAGARVTDEFLRTMFLQRLPTSVRSILATSSDPLDNLAAMADKIVDINSQNSYLSDTVCANSTTSQIETLTQQLQQLVTTVNELKESRQERRFRFRSRSRSRNRPEAHQSGHCWYHNNFGENARKCVQPCTYQTKNEDQRR